MIKNYTEFLIENIKWWDSEGSSSGRILEEEEIVNEDEMDPMKKFKNPEVI